MKLIRSILLSLTLIVLTNCSNPANFQSEKNVEKPNSPPILEMSQELRGLWGINGELLDFRLYENGFIEYEILDNDKKVSGKINKTKDIKIKKKFRINETEVNEILSLLASNEFLNLDNVYKPKRSCIDNFISNVIHFRYKEKDKTI